MKHVWNCPETKDALGEVRVVTGVGGIRHGRRSLSTKIREEPIFK